MRLNGNLTLNAGGLSQIENAVVERVAVLPAVVAGEKGRFVFLTSDNKIYFNTGAAWSALATGGNADSIQAEIDALESSLGALITVTGEFNAAGAVISNVTAATSVTDVLVQLGAAISAEKTRAEAAEAGLQSAINAEVTRATGAEGDLATLTTTTKGNLVAAINEVDADLAAEVTRATAAEGTLQGNIDTVSNALAAEVTRATGAEGTLQGNITTVATNLSAEVTRAQNAEAALAADIQSKMAGLTWKNAVRVMSNTNVDIATGGLNVIVDSVKIDLGDRVLLNGQTNASENGIYVVNDGPWTRATDMDATTPIDEFNSAAVFVSDGMQYSDTGWTETAYVDTIGVSEVHFTQFNGAAGITAGFGLEKDGNTLAVKGDGASITISAAGVKLSEDLQNEISAATAAIAAETTRATGAEGDLATLTTSAKGNLVAAINEVDADLAAEVTRATAAEGTLTTNLEAEVTRATAAEAALSAKVGKMYFLYDGASATSHTVTHSLGQKFCNVTVVDAATDEVIIPQSIVFGDANALTVTLNAALAIKVVVMGLV